MRLRVLDIDEQARPVRTVWGELANGEERRPSHTDDDARRILSAIVLHTRDLCGLLRRPRRDPRFDDSATGGRLRLRLRFVTELPIEIGERIP
jgi:hypothetical protein